MSISSRIGAALVVAGFCAASAAADPPTMLGKSESWSAYQATTDSGKVCYMLSKPQTSEPANAVRGPIFLIVGDWPGRKVKGEVEIVSGYPFKEGSKALAQVGTTKVELFTNNDGGTGSGWIISADDESAFVDAMRSGSLAVVRGISKRGTHTTDSYALNGAAQLLDTIHDACSK